MLPLALTATILICTYAITLSFSWRIAPPLQLSSSLPASWNNRESVERGGLAGNLVHVEDLGAFDG